MASPELRTPFTAQRARQVLVEACVALDLPADGAAPIRLGENAIFHLPRPGVVVRIGRSVAKAPVVAKELCLARWLAEQGIPATSPYGSASEPAIVEGHPVSVWHYVEPGDPAPGVVDLAGLLRRLHDLEGAPCQLPPPDPLALTATRLATITGLPERDHEFLTARVDELREAYAEVEFALKPGVIHGDAHTGNLLGGAGAAVIGDFEASAIGAREWDLVPLAISRVRFGRGEGSYQAFTECYGFDVTRWPGYPVLRDIRELYMTVWLAQNAAHGPREAAEVALRIRTIRDGDDSTEWHVF